MHNRVFVHASSTRRGATTAAGPEVPRWALP